MAKSLHVKAKTPWKRIAIPKSTFDDDIFDGLIDIQELTDYEFVKKSTSKDTPKKRKAASDKDEVTQQKKQKTSNGEQEVDGKVKKGKSRKKKKLQESNVISESENQEITLKQGKAGTKVTENVKGTKTIQVETSKKKGKKRKKTKEDKSNESTTTAVVNGETVPKPGVKDLSGDVSKENESEIPKKKAKKKRKNNPRRKKKASEESTPSTEIKTTNTVPPVAKDKKDLSADVSKENDPAIAKKKAKKKKSPRRKKKAFEELTPTTETMASNTALPVAEDKNSPVKGDRYSTVGMSKWNNLFVPDVILKSLHEQGFKNPTTIQTLTLPSAIRDHQDILAAAETGSGKTLAFGIPVVANILSYQERCGKDVHIAPKHKKILPEENDSSDSAKEDDSSDEVSDVDDDDESQEAEKRSPPLALILEPTRELAAQVHKHLSKMSKYTNIKFALVVGGMSVEKQRRLLRHRPEVIIATPGRLWQLIEEGDEHLSQMDKIRSLVVDEADRMVEKGHYEELTKLLHMINESAHRDMKRQSFVMSATLTMEMSIPKRVLGKVKVKDLETDKLKMLTHRICVGTKPKVIDLTPKDKVAQSLSEMRVNCSAEEKDLYLYYFLCQHPGRTLVFANSKDCLRRLVSVFNLLECSPYPLHADMQQRQRLKNLDRFSENDKGLLLASDVAARGLDIPNVDYVLHYQVPQTMENYVHRSGRTARASNVGLSVMLVAPEDAKNYRKIVQGVKNGEELPIMPLNLDLMPAVKQRISLARTIDVSEYRAKKVRLHNDFFSKAAEEMDMIVDDKDFIPENDSVEKAQEKQQLKAMRQQLSAMLKGSLAPLRMTKYPTKSGKLMSMKAVNLYDSK